MFETLFSNIKQYIIVRSVVPSEADWAEFADQELLKLYRPIVDTNVEDGINIYITEDTELEKGITDTIVNNFDNIIMRLLFDYLFWLLKEKEGERVEKWFASDNGDYINVEKTDKFLFLKYGEDRVSDCLDLEGALNCLFELILKGNDTLTYSRAQFISKRTENDPFEILEAELEEEELDETVSEEAEETKETQEIVEDTPEEPEEPEENPAKPKKKSSKTKKADKPKEAEVPTEETQEESVKESTEELQEQSEVLEEAEASVEITEPSEAETEVKEEEVSEEPEVTPEELPSEETEAPKEEPKAKKKKAKKENEEE